MASFVFRLSRPRSRRRNRPLLLLLPLALAACGGSGGSDDGSVGGGSGGGGSGSGGAVSTGIALLDRYFVQSFAPFEGAARALVETDARYLLQSTDWYVDANSNGVFDPASETLRNAYPLLSSGVHFAHAAGLTGAGVVLSIIDDGFRPDHEAFAGKTIDVTGAPPVLDHGTTVASVAAGNSGTMIGMAPGADLALGSYATLSGLATATQRAGALGAVAQNNSWGFVGTPVGSASYTAVFGSADGQSYLSALRSYAATGVVIFAAENDSSLANAGLMPALPALEPGLEDGWIAVINGDPTMSGDDVVAATRISGACLQAAPWCLAAEGAWTGATAASTTSYGFATGTSFATPMVAGAMAILAEAFPDLSPHDLRIRLLASADNSFAGFTATGEVELVPGYRRAISSEWGHGFLDVQAALLPIGPTTAVLGDGTVYDIAEPLAIEGQATGDAVTRALTGVSVAVDDALSASFLVPAEGLVARRAGPALTEALRASWDSGTGLDCCGPQIWFPDARKLSAEGDGVALHLALPEGSDGEGSFGLMVEGDLDGETGGLSLRLGLGHDAGSLLPRWHSGAGTTLVIGEAALDLPLGGAASLRLSTGLGASADGIGLSTASAALTGRGVFGKGDRLSVSVGLPVAVSGGSTSIALPVATMGGTPQMSTIPVDMAPEDRELRLGIEYLYPLSRGADMVLSLAHAENYGNVSGQRDTGAFLGFRARF